jgi:ubiquinone/menaquinone biosynthesis C-methylase UbiE
MTVPGIFFEIHSGLPREGPGDDQSTERAFRTVRGLPPNTGILDVGCGPGAQTLVLARTSGGSVTAVDNHAPFLEELRSRATAAGLQDRIRIVRGSMFDLPLRESAFDLIWSEGAIYIMGFEAGLRSWRRFLRPGGWIVVSEAAWLKDNPPREVLDFWQSGYPGIKTIEDDLAVTRNCGYDAVGHFVLPPESWWEPYYRPLQERIARLREKYRGHAEAERFLDQETAEIALYRKYSDYYGYVFFIMKAAG